jgi:drug/metabolite transporter (DMT)-like permease
MPVMPQLLWGVLIISFAPILIHIAPLSADEIALYRMALGALFFFVFGVFYRHFNSTISPADVLNRREKIMAALGGAAFAIDLMCWHRSIHYIGPGLATLVVSTQVLMVGGASFFLPGPNPRKPFWFSAALCLSGLCLLAGGSQQVNILLGLALSGVAAVGYTVYLLTLKQIAQPTMNKTLQVMQWVSTSAALWVGSYMGWDLWHRQVAFALPQQGKTWLIILCYGLLIQGVAWTLIAWAMRKMRPFRVSLFLILQPLLATVWDALFFGRRLSGVETLGVLLVFLGILCSFLFTNGNFQPPWRKSSLSRLDETVPQG